MSINTAIYGTPEQWYSPTNFYQYLSDDTKKLKFVNFADIGEDEQLARWNNGVEYGKITANEMPDKSISVGLLPADSAYNAINFYPYTGTTKDVIVEERKNELIPFYFTFSGGYSSSNPNFSTAPDKEFAPDADYVGNDSYENRVVAEMPYKHFIACPIIRAYNENGDVKQFGSITAYENEKDVYNKPVLAGFEMYYQTRDDRERTKGNLLVSTLSLKAEMLMTHLDDDISFTYNLNTFTILFGCYKNKINWSGYSYSKYHHQTIIGADKFNITMDTNIYNWDVEYIGSPDNFIAETKRQMAMFGIPFALDVATAESGDFDSENMCIPITNNGIGTGEFTQGTGNKDNPAYSWTEQREDSGVNPFNPDTNNYVDDTPTSNVSLGAWRVFNSAYVLNANELSRFANYLWNGGNSENWLDQWLNGLKLMGENPINAVIGVKYFPFDIAQYLQILSPNLTGIIIGNNLPPVAVVGLNLRDIDTQNNNIVLDLGTAKFPKYFDNFLDFEPYTTAELYIPYCKRIKITPAFFVGKTISIKLIVDLITGACVGCVYSDNILYYTVEGVIGIDIPVTGRDNAGYAQQILSSVMGGVSSAMTGNIGGFVESGISQMTRPQIETTGTTTPANSFILPQNAYLFIHSPIPQIPSTYAHTFGNACSIGGTVGNFSGFTVFSNTDLTGISATDNEKMQIESLLNTGVYL